jgi:predicted naringenin-chalcone synthase
MTATILGLGTATPPRSIRQDDAARLAQRLVPPTSGADPDAAARTLAALYRRSGIQTRASVLLDAPTPGADDALPEQTFFPPAAAPTDRGPGTAARMARYAAEAPLLAERAARAALTESGLAPANVTHLVTASCTGFSAPGLDASLIAALGLRPTTLRTHVGFMGCHGAINALRVAKAFSDADPAARVLVACVELCSLHFHYTAEPDRMVANALFADGAAAAVVSGSAPASSAPRPRVSASSSCLIPDSADAMTWSIGDHGFEMTLSPRVPDLIARHLAPWLRAWLDSQGLALTDVGAWAIHPGGPRVISAVVDALGLPPTAAAPSRDVLAHHGNMSSPTVLFIVDHLRRAAAPNPLPPTALLAFGPGLVAEAALLT